MIKVLLITVAGMMTLLMPVASVSADRASLNYQYLLATGPLCSLAADACPDVARAENGDTIMITGQGTFSLLSKSRGREFSDHSKSITGDGSFVHKNSAGQELGRGTWKALQLLSFHSYGSGSVQGLPSNFEGGLALVRVQLLVGGMPIFHAVLRVDCELGNVPPGAHEGLRLAIQGLDLNFNKEVSGLTLFIRQ